jgi:hypothetical protein
MLLLLLLLLPPSCQPFLKAGLRMTLLQAHHRSSTQKQGGGPMVLFQRCERTSGDDGYTD